MLTPEKIESNYRLFEKLLSKCGSRADNIKKMLDVIGERLAVAPASSRKKYHAAFPGGLVDHSLRVLDNTKKMNELYKLSIPIESIIIGALFHDLGKVGDLVGDLYLPQENAWRRDNLGETYLHNEAIQRMPNSERGLWLLQHFGVTLTMDEWLAIRLNDGQYVEENHPYKMAEPDLALIVHQADRMACQQEKALQGAELDI